MKLLFATTNRGKLGELIELVGRELEVVSLKDLPPLPEVEEDQPTFEGNARKKAQAYAQGSGLPALADDSGLCVDALGGRPGVQSARYGADDEARIKRLLGELAEVPESQRTASFQCVLCLALPDGRTWVEQGACSGRIVQEPRGTQGFGYDPIFLADSLFRTLAEVSRSEKSAYSHRGAAFRKMLPRLVELGRGTL